MKKLAILTLVLGSAFGALAQGTVNFNNRVTAAGIFAPIYGVVPGAQSTQLSGLSTTNGGSVNYGAAPLLAGSGFTAALYGSIVGGDPTTNLVGTAPFKTTANQPGIIAGPSTGLDVAGTAPGGFATFIVRAWDNAGGTVNSWSAALGRADLGHGQSAPFSPTGALGSLGGGLLTPGNLIGMPSFNLILVPEPSLIALGALGLGALLLRRRKA